LLFGATISSQVHHIVKNYMKHPILIKAESYVDKEKLLQDYYDVPSRDKFSLLAYLLKKEDKGLIIIFCATRRIVDILTRNLNHIGIKAGKLHGGLSQNKRKESIDMFHNHRFNILIASDVAARGLDIKNVSHIINYDVPKTSKEYIHRIGRTARAGDYGKVISLLSERDYDNFRNVLKDRFLIVKKLELPEFQRIPFFKLSKHSDEGYSHYNSKRRFHKKPFRKYR
ncbi:MAG: DEAD/DEAH box helicase, partial [Nanoarchaeota archaeon]